ncbi:uncharacterized protein K444DRAFT_621318 [Hyaloscypha bicolor E]|uniref:Uncharacterized protein n=1 Tax=Hyaloscypha bicolor E TaxID=1095630 RepID=A0A2J6SN78_9HELO|nr:uncharacterized protein K444DRAFT_621318 [Hyaloscypha bicolor E]PMD52170.1 hypothetical protein K444DRAFT_621318 [Hyaloscypha bicolor E]
MGRPRAHRPHVKRPSPLQQVHSTRPLSQAPEPEAAPPAVGLVRDPHFWKRFSTAVHMSEVTGDVEQGLQKSEKTSVGTKDEWLAQQHREKRHCRVLCASITSVVVLLVIAAAIVGWYFTKVRKI